ncbi:hypothetical protein [Halobaculum roseum]|uniref:Uncharacterized protein n=1 Tax=Halobaculum roseum TaxID=2175149 RepID=A0ABD5MW12_9EURY|nr:hypothetical protein [Halobaculum roseum]QZY01778.1 hypothetical protein K6T36_10625 [Halobaculum roseum]
MDGGTSDPGAASHRALRAIRRELERHPAVESARGLPEGSFVQVVAQLSTDHPAIGGDATLTVRWFAGSNRADPPEFSFHYSDADGDFGWHHEPNPHVDGWGHVQRRGRHESSYAYRPYEFASLEPARVVWEVMDRCLDELSEE